MRDSRHVARLIAVVHQLTHATMLRRNYDLDQKAIGMYYDIYADDQELRAPLPEAVGGTQSST